MQSDKGKKIQGKSDPDGVSTFIDLGERKGSKSKTGYKKTTVNGQKENQDDVLETKNIKEFKKAAMVYRYFQIVLKIKDQFEWITGN